MTSRDLFKMLMKDGWREDRQRGSHKQLKHPTKKGTITIPVHPGKDIPKRTLNAILKPAGLK